MDIVVSIIILFVMWLAIIEYDFKIWIQPYRRLGVLIKIASEMKRHLKDAQEIIRIQTRILDSYKLGISPNEDDEMALEDYNEIIDEILNEDLNK